MHRWLERVSPSRIESWRLGYVRTGATGGAESRRFGIEEAGSTRPCDFACGRDLRRSPCGVMALRSSCDVCKQMTLQDDRVVAERLFAAVSSARFVTDWSPAIVAVFKVERIF